MATGFVLVLLREIRESILKLRQETSDRLDQTNERLEQTLASLTRVESDLNEIKKFTRRIALNQAKHEQVHSQTLENLEGDVRDLKEQIQRTKEGL